MGSSGLCLIALVTKFDILEVENDGQIHQRVVKVDKNDGSRKRYVTKSYLRLSKSIMKSQASTLVVSFNKLKQIYANMQQIIAYVECCEICHQKQGRVMKSIVVKPIVSSKFNSRYQVDCIDM